MRQQISNNVLRFINQCGADIALILGTRQQLIVDTVVQLPVFKLQACSCLFKYSDIAVSRVQAGNTHEVYMPCVRRATGC